MGSSPLSLLFTSATVRTVPVHTTLKCDTEPSYPICDAPHGEISTGKLRFLTEIAPKSPFLCRVNSRSPIRYDFRASAETILYSVNMALVLDSGKPFTCNYGYKPQKPNKYSTNNKGVLIPHNWQILRCCTQMFRGNGRGSSKLRSSIWALCLFKDTK